MSPRKIKASASVSSTSSVKRTKKAKRTEEQAGPSNDASSSSGRMTKKAKRTEEQAGPSNDSPKRISYNPKSQSLEKRDKRYTQLVEREKLKSLRLVATSVASDDDDDDEDGFCGFKTDETNELKDWVKSQIEALYTSIDEDLLEPAPFEDENDDFWDLSGDQLDIPIDVDHQMDIVHLIPLNEEDQDDEDAAEDGAEDAEDDIIYNLHDKGSRHGNDVIEDSHGHTYNFWRQGKGKFPKYTSFQCIIRNNKDKANCKCYVKIENFHLGEDGWVVHKMYEHNHDQNYANILRKEINAALAEMAVNFINTPTNLIVEKVLQENAHYKNFYENHSTMSMKKSMFKLVQRARAAYKAPAVSKDPNFKMDKSWVKQPNFFRCEVQVLEARHFICYTDVQLMYMSQAHAWYIDGTFKIVKHPIKQLLTIHCILLSENQRVSVPVCYVLMTRRREMDYKKVLLEIYSHCCRYVRVKQKDESATPNLAKIMADFEIALWQAIRHLKDENVFYSDLCIKGCYFHLTQAIFRKIMHFHLKPDYFKRDGSGVRVILKWLMALVLLPSSEILTTFYVLVDKMKEITNATCRAKLQELFNYYETNWMKGKNWSINDICQWGCSVRTNNDAERFHSKLMGNIQQTNVEFYELINILGTISLTIESDSRLFAMGLLRSKPKKDSKDFIILLRQASLKLKSKQISNVQFLNMVTASDHNNQTTDVTWLQNSRVDLLADEEFDYYSESGSEGD